MKFSSLFTFIYSPREGTPAAAMADPVSREEKGTWFNELLQVQEKIAKENMQSLVGCEYRVLCDDYGHTEGLLSGHTSGTAVVEFEGDDSLIGKFVNVKVDSYSNVLKGTII